MRASRILPFRTALVLGREHLIVAATPVLYPQSSKDGGSWSGMRRGRFSKSILLDGLLSRLAVIVNQADAGCRIFLVAVSLDRVVTEVMQMNRSSKCRHTTMGPECAKPQPMGRHGYFREGRESCADRMHRIAT